MADTKRKRPIAVVKGSFDAVSTFITYKVAAGHELVKAGFTVHYSRSDGQEMIILGENGNLDRVRSICDSVFDRTFSKHSHPKLAYSAPAEETENHVLIIPDASVPEIKKLEEGLAAAYFSATKDAEECRTAKEEREALAKENAHLKKDKATLVERVRVLETTKVPAKIEKEEEKLLEQIKALESERDAAYELVETELKKQGEGINPQVKKAYEREIAGLKAQLEDARRKLAKAAVGEINSVEDAILLHLKAVAPVVDGLDTLFSSMKREEEILAEFNGITLERVKYYAYSRNASENLRKLSETDAEDLKKIVEGIYDGEKGAGISEIKRELEQLKAKAPGIKKLLEEVTAMTSGTGVNISTGVREIEKASTEKIADCEKRIGEYEADKASAVEKIVNLAERYSKVLKEKNPEQIKAIEGKTIPLMMSVEETAEGYSVRVVLPTHSTVFASIIGAASAVIAPLKTEEGNENGLKYYEISLPGDKNRQNFNYAIDVARRTAESIEQNFANTVYGRNGVNITISQIRKAQCPLEEIAAEQTAAHEEGTKEKIARLITEAGAEGISAGALSKQLEGLKRETKFYYLNQLKKEGIITSEGNTTNMVYRAATAPVETVRLTDKESQVVEYMRQLESERGWKNVSTTQITKKLRDLGMSEKLGTYVLRRLVDKGILTREGANRWTRYTLREQ